MPFANPSPYAVRNVRMGVVDGAAISGVGDPMLSAYHGASDANATAGDATLTQSAIE